ncbi:MAG TPA: hypothetical protein DIV86_05765 [Alphaproteobacteria bacterium]|nr:hypothetical protein [Alphaproteobacteria bacterium]
MMNLGFISQPVGLATFGLIFLSSLLFLQPYIADIQELTLYVKKLASDENPEKPNLSFLNNVDELTAAIEQLNKSWIKKSESLNMLIEEDRKKQNLIKDFVANASHEMKTPLASINGFVETLLEQENDPETIKEFLNIIKSQGNRLTKLVNDMLVLSVAESGIGRNNFEILDMEDILEQAILSMKTLAMEKNITLAKEISKDVRKVNGNRDEILRIFDNIISNAIKYSADNTKVIIKIYNTNNLNYKFKEYLPEQNMVCCEFIDEGEGLSPENIERLSERFFRVDKSRSRKVGGTGLGLSIVKHMLHNHDAKMVIKSEQGKGSNFTVFFPVV